MKYNDRFPCPTFDEGKIELRHQNQILQMLQKQCSEGFYKDEEAEGSNTVPHTPQ